MIFVILKYILSFTGEFNGDVRVRNKRYIIIVIILQRYFKKIQELKVGNYQRLYHNYLCYNVRITSACSNIIQDARSMGKKVELNGFEPDYDFGFILNISHSSAPQIFLFISSIVKNENFVLVFQISKYFIIRLGRLRMIVSLNRRHLMSFRTREAIGK